MTTLITAVKETREDGERLDYRRLCNGKTKQLRVGKTDLLEILFLANDENRWIEYLPLLPACACLLLLKLFP